MHEGAVEHLHGRLAECEELRLNLLEERHGTGNLNVVFPTLGGKQVWADVFVASGWRIQQNHYREHFRLLDAGDDRWAWGSYEACRVAFERQRIQRDLRPGSRHAVVLVHGLIRSKASMAGQARALRRADHGSER